MNGSVPSLQRKDFILDGHPLDVKALEFKEGFEPDKSMLARSHQEVKGGPYQDLLSKNLDIATLKDRKSILAVAAILVIHADIWFDSHDCNHIQKNRMCHIFWDFAEEYVFSYLAIA